MMGGKQGYHKVAIVLGIIDSDDCFLNLIFKSLGNMSSVK
jgi:hypothetical protein